MMKALLVPFTLGQSNEVESPSLVAANTEVLCVERRWAGRCESPVGSMRNSPLVSHSCALV